MQRWHDMGGGSSRGFSTWPTCDEGSRRRGNLQTKPLSWVGTLATKKWNRLFWRQFRSMIEYKRLIVSGRGNADRSLPCPPSPHGEHVFFSFCFLANWNLFDTSRGGVKTFYWPWLKPPVLRAQLPSGPDDHECEPGGRAKYSLGQDRKKVRNRSVKMRNRSVQCWLTRFLQKVDRIVTLNREIKMKLSENYMSILQNKLGQVSWSGAEVHRVRRPGSHSWRGKLSRPRRRHRRHCPSRPGYHW